MVCTMNYSIRHLIKDRGNKKICLVIIQAQSIDEENKAAHDMEAVQRVFGGPRGLFFLPSDNVSFNEVMAERRRTAEKQALGATAKNTSR